jgi:tRNA pseudouridine13 synthase
MQQRAAALRRTGCPNYFDDQRFGSFVPGQAPFGRLLVEGRYEEALRRYFTDPSPGDNKRTRSAKQRLNDLWGQWDRLLKDLPRGEPRAAAAYLKDHPEDFAGALDHLNAPLHSLLTHAWQSALWNRMLSKVMERLLPEEVLDHHPGRAGAFVFADRYPADALATLFDLQLPLPHARAAVPEPAVEAWREVLEEEGMAAEELRIRKLRRLYLKKGERDAWLDLGSLQLDAAGVDTLNEGRLAVTLRLQLPPGAYATIVIKELTRGFWRPSQRRRRRRRQK